MTPIVFSPLYKIALASAWHVKSRFILLGELDVQLCVCFSVVLVPLTSGAVLSLELPLGFSAAFCPYRPVPPKNEPGTTHVPLQGANHGTEGHLRSCREHSLCVFVQSRAQGKPNINMEGPEDPTFSSWDLPLARFLVPQPSWREIPRWPRNVPRTRAM